MSPNGRSQDIDAIVDVIEKAEKFIHISVMDFFPVSLYTPKPKSVFCHFNHLRLHSICFLKLKIIQWISLNSRYWPVIDNALRAAAIDRRVSVKLLISWWKHSRPAEDYFLNSLKVISNSYPGVDLQVVCIQ